MLARAVTMRASAASQRSFVRLFANHVCFLGMVLAPSTPHDGASGQGRTSLYLLRTAKYSIHEVRNSLLEFDFDTGAHQRELVWEASEVGGAVDLKVVDAHLYVGFERAIRVVDLADTANELTSLRLPAGEPDFQSIALHGDELMAFSACGYSWQPQCRAHVTVFNRSDWRQVRSFGIMGSHPGDFGELAGICCVSGLLVVVEHVRVSGEHQCWVCEDRLQVLALTGEPLFVMASRSPLLPPPHLHPSKRFPLHVYRPRLCAGRGINADRLIVCGDQGRRSDRRSGHVWSLRIVRPDRS